VLSFEAPADMPFNAPDVLPTPALFEDDSDESKPSLVTADAELVDSATWTT
jgi:hypothetical protein